MKVNFLSGPQCPRCVRLRPMVQNFAEKNNLTYEERNAKSREELVDKDIGVLQVSKQRALPIIYFEDTAGFAVVSPNTWDLQAAFNLLIKRTEDGKEEEGRNE